MVLGRRLEVGTLHVTSVGPREDGSEDREQAKNIYPVSCTTLITESNEVSRRVGWMGYLTISNRPREEKNSF